MLSIRPRLLFLIGFIFVFLLITGTVLASPNWLPLPQINGPEVSASASAWRPVAQVGCSTFRVDVTSPTTDQYAFGIVEVRWYVDGIYDFNDNLIPSESGEFAAFNYSADSGGDTGQTRGKTFAINTPLDPGTRVKVKVSRQHREVGETTLGHTISDEIGDTDYVDRWLRAYVPALSNEDASGNVREYSCGTALASQPQVRLNFVGGNSQNEGDSTNDVQLRAELVDGSGQPVTTTQPVRVYVEAIPRTDLSEREPDGGTVYTDDLVLLSPGNAQYPFAETIDVPYNHSSCSSSTLYCDPPPPDKPISMDAVIPAGQSAVTFTVRVLGENVPEQNDNVDFFLAGVSNARRETTSTVRYVIADDDQQLVNTQDTSVSFCGVPDGSVSVNVPIVMAAPVTGDVRLSYTTGSSNMIGFIEYSRIPAIDPNNPAQAEGSLATIASGATTTNATINLNKGATGGNFRTSTQFLDVHISRRQNWFEDPRDFFWEFNYPGVPFIEGDMTARIIRETYGPTVSVSNVAITEGNAGQQNLTFTLTLAEPALDPSGTPSPVTIGYQTVDGTATAGQDYQATSGTVTFDVVNGTQNLVKTVNVPIVGDTEFELNETFTLQLNSPSGVCISPTAGSATGTINNDDSAPNMTILDASASESAGVMTFDVQLSAASYQQTTVNYTTSNGTAVSGEHYTSTSGQLTIPANTTSGTITVDLIDNNIASANRNFNVTLSGVSGATIADGSATGTIIDDDQPTVSITSQPSYNEAAGSASLAVTLSNPSELPVTVDFTTVDGSALAGEDYTSESGQVTFNSLETERSINVTLLTDSIDEPDQSFDVVLSNPANATLGTAATTVTLVDDDNPPTVSLGDASGQEASGKVTFTATLGGLSQHTITIPYTTASGTATGGTDYDGAAGSVVIAPENLWASFDIPVFDDAVAEAADETFTVTLGAAANVTPGDVSAVGTIIEDDYAGIQIVQSGESTAVAETGMTTDTYTVELTSQPSGAVDVRVEFDGQQVWLNGSAQPLTLHFDTNNWNQPQTVTVMAVDDFVAEADPHTVGLRHVVTSAAPGYNSGVPITVDGVAADTVQVSIDDNDAISAVPNNLQVSGDLNEAPLNLAFSWTHQAGQGNFTVAADWYHLLVTKAGVNYIDQWYKATTFCIGIACSVPFVDQSPYVLENGTYDWMVQGYRSGAYVDSDTSQFTINLSVPAMPLISSVDTTYGQPTVYWGRDASTTWYQLRIRNSGGVLVFNQWKRKGDICNTTTCALASGTMLPDGDYTAIALGWGPRGFGQESAPYPFTIFNPPPAAPTNLAVTNIDSGTPTFSWDVSSNATWYHLAVKKAGTNALTLNKWYSAADLGCDLSEICAITPGAALTNGDWVWAAQAWGPAGFNGGSSQLWTVGPAFTMSTGAPEKPVGLNVLNADSGTPTFQWTHSTGASWYFLVVSSAPTGVVHQKWYAAADINCATNTCSVQPPLNLKNGTYDWRVKAWGPAGFNEGSSEVWSLAQFTVNAPAPTLPTLYTPEGAISERTPTFSWSEVSGATWYHVWVEFNGLRIYHRWLSAAEANCTGGTCSAMDASITLNPGTYQWKMRAYSPAGIGDWSGMTQFEVLP